MGKHFVSIDNYKTSIRVVSTCLYTHEGLCTVLMRQMASTHACGSQLRMHCTTECSQGPQQLPSQILNLPMAQVWHAAYTLRALEPLCNITSSFGVGFDELAIAVQLGHVATHKRA